MIPLSNNSQPSYSRGEHFKGEYLRYLRSTMSTTILLIALLLVLVFSQRCTADSRYNYDTHNYDALHITALTTTTCAELTTSPRSQYEVH